MREPWQPVLFRKLLFFMFYFIIINFLCHMHCVFVFLLAIFDGNFHRNIYH